MRPVDDPLLSDEELMRLLQNGENSAIGVLYERHSRLILSDCRRILRNGDAARDLTNEVFVRVMRKRGLYLQGSPGSFSGWLHRIAHNLCINHLKKSVIARSVPLEDEPSVPATAMRDNEGFSVEQLEAALAKLSDKQRVCLKMFYIEEKSYDEIVRLTGMRPGDVRSAIQNGRLRLQRMLGKKNS